MPDTVHQSPDVLMPWLGDRSFANAKAEFDREGHITFKNVLNRDDLTAIRNALAPHFDEDMRGRNDFEGLSSNRVYAMLAKSPVFADLAIHPLALTFAEADLGRDCLLSACLGIKLHPGETAQPWHFDDSCGIPRPRPTTGLSAFWAITDVTEGNGATEFIPGSHLWGEEAMAGGSSAADFTRTTPRDINDDPGARDDAVKAVMPAGSVMFAKGTLWHRGGANRSDAPRTIITTQYCSGFMRQLENMVLAVPPESAAQLPERARELIGYSIHPPFMGYVDGMHPARCLRGLGQAQSPRHS